MASNCSIEQSVSVRHVTLDVKKFYYPIDNLTPDNRQVYQSKGLALNL